MLTINFSIKRLYLLLILSSLGFSQTEVGGIIFDNTTWGLEESPYIVVSSTIVPDSVTLSIEPGVTVKLESLKSIQIDGALIAQGTLGNKIIFTSNQATPAAGDWGQILFTSSSQDAQLNANGEYISGSVLEYCEISYGGNSSNAMIKADEPSPLIDNCLISHSSTNGLDCVGNSIVVRNSTINNSFYRGMLWSTTYLAPSCSLTFVGNTVSQNNRQGLYINCTEGYALVDNNQILNNGWDGLYAGNCNGDVSITNNFISSNYRGLYLSCGCRATSTGLVSGNVIVDNYAGQSVGSWPNDNGNYMGNIGSGAGIEISGQDMDYTIEHNLIFNNGAYATYAGVYINGLQMGEITESEIEFLFSENIIVDNYVDESSSNEGSAGLSVGTIRTKNSARVTISKNSILGNRSKSNSGAQLNLIAESAIGHNNFTENLISNNVCTSAGKAAVEFGGWGGYDSYGGALYTNNNIIDNDSEYIVKMGVTLVGSSVNIGSNFWGITDEAQIQSALLDWFDDPSLFIGAYDPPLQSLNLDAPITPPRNVVSENEGDGVRLSWEPNNEADVAGYRIHYGTPTGYTFINSIDVGNVTEYYLSGISVHDSIAVTAYDLLADSNIDQYEGHESWFTVASLPPNPPTDLSSYYTSATSITLSWVLSNSDNITQYLIYRGQSTNPTNLLDTINVTNTYTDINLTHGITYFYRLRAVNSAGIKSDFSNDAELSLSTTLNIPNEYSAIQTGLNAAGTNDTVLVQPGTYYENIIWPETYGIKLQSAGDTSNTIIDGGNNGSVIIINGSGLTIDSTTIISGFKITNGTSIFYGGGIAMDSVANPILEDLLFVNNAAYYGGALSCKQASPIITNVVARNNTATEGGAYYFYDYSNATLTDVEVSYNTANKGGGIFCNEYASPVIKRAQINNNTASLGGGGIFSKTSGNFSLTESEVSYNSCYGADWGENDGGGGIRSGPWSNPTIRNTIISNNYSEGYGGGYRCAASSPILEDITFLNNTSLIRGGGLSLYSVCEVELRNSTFIDNSSNMGGGLNIRGIQDASVIIGNQFINNSSNTGGAIHLDYCSPSFLNNTLSNNEATAQGDGIWSISASSAFSQNNIYRNGEGYYNNSDNSVLNLANNYWGDPSGPYHVAYNTTGIGDTTSMFTNPTPFLATPNLIAPPIPIQNVDVTATGNDFVSISWESSPLTDLASYRVYYGTDTAQYAYANSIDLATLGNTFTIDGLALSSTYYIAVTCIDTADNESWYSNRIEGVTRAILTQNLDIAGDEDLYHLITHDPIITFDYFDSMAETQTNYHVQISTDSTFLSNMIWDTGVVASDATSIQYTAGALLNGVKYYLQAKVASGAFWSEWTSLAFGMNTEPSTPLQVSLIDDEVTTGDVLLEISNSSDAEGDNLSYDFRLYDANQSIQLDSTIAMTEDPEGTAWNVLTALEDNAQHWWTVQAYDGYEYSTIAGPGSFLVNTVNDIPAAFSLLFPGEDEEITSQSPLLRWEPSDDPDPLDTVSYALYLDTPEPGIETFDLGTDTSYQIVTDLLDNTTYSWKVVASDVNGESTENTGSYMSFRVNTENDLPTAFDPLAPEDGSMVTDLTPTLVWEPSSDPDDPMLRGIESSEIKEIESSNEIMLIASYQVYLDTDSLFVDTEPVAVFNPEYTPDMDLMENVVYYWKIEAVDDDGGTLFSDRWSFWTNAENEAPVGFHLFSPMVDEVLTVVSPTFVWEPSSDPDLQDGFDYNLVLGTDPGNMDTVWSGADTSLTLEWELDDNQTYYWSVFAEDWSGLTTFNIGGYQSFTVNTTNDLPEYFELLYPVWDEMVTNLQPEFLWEASSDPDDETLLLRSKGKGHLADQSGSGNTVQVITGYDFYLSTDSMLTDVVPIEVFGTSYSPDADLTENQVYYWAVSAVDDSGGVTFSDTASFWTNNVNSVPAVFSLLTPVDDTESIMTPTFTWTMSTDADLQDTLNYTLRYGTDVFSLMDTPNGSFTQFSLTESLIDNTEYIWQVVAEDISGAAFATEFSSFFVNSENDNPGLFSLIAPDSASWITNLDLMLVWEPSTDLEGADIEYIVHLGTDSESLDPVDTISVNYYALNDLEDGYYYWQVEALDNLEGSQLSEIWSFLINVNNDPPDPFALTYPEADLVLTEQQPTFTWEASSSGDAGDHTSYRVELGNSAESMVMVFEGDSTLYTPELPLEDNSIYYWRVIAIDLAFATTVNEGGYQSFAVNTINDTPTIAELISPDSVVVLSDIPTFSWNASTDVDPYDSLSYELHWWTDLTEMDSILTTATSVSPETPLADDNLQYFWNVITMDANGGIAHSEENTFWVDFMPEVPASFALLGPDSASAGNGTRPELTWAEAIDPDPFDAVHYSVAVATDSLMENVIYEQVAHVEVTIPEIDLENDTRYYWQVKAIDEDSLTTASSIWTFDVGYLAIDQYAQVPTEFVLDQNYPNPFNPSTTIRYGLPEESNVSLVIYDVRGQVVQTLASAHQSAGWYDVVWNGQTQDGKSISTGIYFARLVAGDYSQVIKMLYLK